MSILEDPTRVGGDGSGMHVNEKHYLGVLVIAGISQSKGNCPTLIEIFFDFDSFG